MTTSPEHPPQSIPRTTAPRFRYGCRTMGDGFRVSAVFAAAGLMMLFTAATLVPAIPWLVWTVQGLGGLLLLFAPLVLIGTSLHTGGGNAGGAAGVGSK